MMARLLWYLDPSSAHQLKNKNVTKLDSLCQNSDQVPRMATTEIKKSVSMTSNTADQPMTPKEKETQDT